MKDRIHIGDYRLPRFDDENFGVVSVHTGVSSLRFSDKEIEERIAAGAKEYVIGTVPPGTYWSAESIVNSMRSRQQALNIAHESAIKRWSDHLAKEAEQASYFAKFMGPGEPATIKDDHGRIMEQVQLTEQQQMMNMAAA